MFRQNSKYRLTYLILALIAFVLETVYSFYRYAADSDKGMSLIAGIVFGVMSIFQAEDLYIFIKNKKSEKLNSAVKSTCE